MKTAKKWKGTTAHYREVLASLPAASVKAALATFAFSSLPTKIECCEAMRRIEEQPGFAGWGRFATKRKRGTLNVPVRVPRAGRAGKGER